MPIMLDIAQFKGLFTNADLEDIPAEYLSECSNFRPVNGRLIRTKGIGAKLTPALSAACQQIFTFIEPNLTNPSGYRYFFVSVNSSTNVVTVYYYDSSGPSMSSLTLPETVYQNYGRNPVIQALNAIRFMPGRLGNKSGNEAKGVWFGYIDREFFDGLYAPTAGFNTYLTNIDPPAFTVSVEDIGDYTSDYETGDIFRYKFSYIYDGVQESLLSDFVEWEVGGASKWMKAEFSLTKSTFNRRVTAIKVYRATVKRTGDDYVAAYGANGTADSEYKHVTTIDLLRGDDEYKGEVDGAWHGTQAVYIPALTTESFDPANYYYRILIDGGGDPSQIAEIVPDTGTGQVVFKCDTGEEFSFGGPALDAAWELQWKPKTGGSWTTNESGVDGAYCGFDVIVLENELVGDGFEDEVVVFGTGSERFESKVVDVEGHIIQVSDDGYGSTPPSDGRDKRWHILRSSDGTYCFYDDGTDIDVILVDNGIPDGAEHFLQNSQGSEKSIRVNSRHAVYISGRLWLANIVLDPGGAEEEEHRDWAAYSELWQPDVVPVSNVRRLADREGGECTGIAEMLGNPVFLKPQAVVTLFGVKTNPNDDTAWSEHVSSHNIGNIAHDGAISVMDTLYICTFDGIYGLRPNNLAESDSTPTEKLRVSDPINDVYEALSTSQKEAIISAFHQPTNEVVFLLGSSLYAMNIMTGDWRLINTSNTPSVMGLDEEANVLCYKASDKKIYSMDENESVAASIKTKTVNVSAIRKEMIRFCWITYKSATDSLTVKLYTENGASPAVTKTLVASSVSVTDKVVLRTYAKKAAVKIELPSSTNDVYIERILLGDVQ